MRFFFFCCCWNLQEAEDLEEGGSDKVAKVAKKKLPKVEENKSKKEHINVVFIGHVGESSSPISNDINVFFIFFWMCDVCHCFVRRVCTEYPHKP